MSVITVDLSIYPLDVVLRACHAFTARCGVFAHRADESSVAIELRPHDPNDPHDFTADFANALLDTHLRARIAEETRTIRELLVAQAFCEADLLDRRDSEGDEYEDIRGIAR